MWMQAQNPVLTGRIDWGTPLGLLLAIGLLLVAALGVLFESGAFTALLDWLMDDPDHRPARIGATPHRGRV